jgi:hypothetical protein
MARQAELCLVLTHLLEIGSALTGSVADTPVFKLVYYLLRFMILDFLCHAKEEEGAQGRRLIYLVAISRLLA